VTSRTATAARPAKADLSRDAIVERALSVMDSDGPDAVTIRRLAQEFGVTPMALYWHVANKDELLAAMGDALLADVTPPPATGSWSTQLRGVVETLVEHLSRHPAAAELVFPRILVAEAGLRLTEFTLALLEDAGFSRDQAADLARMGLQTAMMLVTQMPGAESQSARDERDAVLAEKRAHVERLPEDLYPHVRAAAEPLTNCDDEAAYYSFGIDLYLEGAQALLRRVKRAG
jgi:TetR/AcrR family transcriptional regulator, tetracycline repressor protein